MSTYVYCAVHNGIVVYIGKGKPGRITHINSGTSHNYKLNEYHFRNKLLNEPLLDVRIVNYYATDKEASEKESGLIKLFKPECNFMMAADMTLEIQYSMIEKFRDDLVLLESAIESYLGGILIT